MGNRVDLKQVRQPGHRRTVRHIADIEQIEQQIEYRTKSNVCSVLSFYLSPSVPGRKMRYIWCFFVLFRPDFVDRMILNGLDDTRRTK